MPATGDTIRSDCQVSSGHSHGRSMKVGCPGRTVKRNATPRRLDRIASLGSRYVLEVRDIRKRFGEVVALDGVSLSVGRGQLVGFLGPNGAGKTTTMRAIMQLVAVDGGTITWDGAPITFDDRRRFGYMPAERGMYPKMHVREQLVYFARLAGRSAAEAGAAADGWLDRLGLGDRANDEVQALSSGNQQRVQLAIALVHDPDLLILDEPFSGLDPIAVETMKAMLLEQVGRGAAVLFSSHQLDLVSDICRDVVIVDRGRVVLDGDVAAIRERSPVRDVTVKFAAPRPSSPNGSCPDGWEVVDDGSDGSVRLRVPASTDLDEVLTFLSRTGRIVDLSFGPPELSEVFRRSVGRTEESL